MKRLLSWSTNLLQKNRRTRKQSANLHRKTLVCRLHTRWCCIIHWSTVCWVRSCCTRRHRKTPFLSWWTSVSLWLLFGTSRIQLKLCSARCSTVNEWQSCWSTDSKNIFSAFRQQRMTPKCVRCANGKSIKDLLDSLVWLAIWLSQRKHLKTTGIFKNLTILTSRRTCQRCQVRWSVALFLRLMTT